MFQRSLMLKPILCMAECLVSMKEILEDQRHNQQKPPLAYNLSISRGKQRVRKKKACH